MEKFLINYSKPKKSCTNKSHPSAVPPVPPSTVPSVPPSRPSVKKNPSKQPSRAPGKLSLLQKENSVAVKRPLTDSTSLESNGRVYNPFSIDKPPKKSIRAEINSPFRMWNTNEDETTDKSTKDIVHVNNSLPKNNDYSHMYVQLPETKIDVTTTNTSEASSQDVVHSSSLPSPAETICIPETNVDVEPTPNAPQEDTNSMDESNEILHTVSMDAEESLPSCDIDVDRIAVQTAITDHFVQTDNVSGPTVAARSTSIYAQYRIPFIQDPVQYGRPMFLSPNSTSSIIAHRYRPQPVELKDTMDSTLDSTLRLGCSCMKFSEDGVLLAVGGTNGTIRVYDFDEVHCFLQRRERLNPSERNCLRHVQPVRTVHTRKDISDLVWLPSRGADEVAVAFRFFTSVHIYDLNTTSCVCSLILGRGGRGGYTSIVSFPAETPDTLYVVAGGAHGHLQSWAIGKRARMRGEVAPVWLGLADTRSLAGPHCEVVALELTKEPNIILSATKSGVLALWNVSKLKVASFGCVASPECVYRICIWDPPVRNLPSNFEAISLPEYSPVLSFSLPYTRPCSHPWSHDSSTITPAGDIVCITLISGAVFLYDYVSKRVVCYPVSPTSIPTTTATSEQSETVVDGNGDQYQNIPRGSHLRCGAVFSFSTGPQICFMASAESRVIDVVRVGGACRQDVERQYSTHLPVSVQLPTHNVNWDWGAWYRQRLSTTPAMQRVASVCHTLPGYVLEATPGNHTITTSSDLSYCLCSLSDMQKYMPSESTESYPATGDYSVHGTLGGVMHRSLKGSRSCVVCLDWTHGRLSWNGSSDSTPEKNSNAVTRTTRSLIRVSGCKITLDSPYTGPSVTQGNPRVYIRSNLSSIVSTPEVPLHCNSRGARATNHGASGIPGEVISRLWLPQRVTAMCSHPTLAIVMAGCWDNSIHFLSPESSS